MTLYKILFCHCEPFAFVIASISSPGTAGNLSLMTLRVIRSRAKQSLFAALDKLREAISSLCGLWRLLSPVVFVQGLYMDLSFQEHLNGLHHGISAGKGRSERHAVLERALPDREGILLRLGAAH